MKLESLKDGKFTVIDQKKLRFIRGGTIDTTTPSPNQEGNFYVLWQGQRYKCDLDEFTYSQNGTLLGGRINVGGVWSDLPPI